MGDQVDRAVLDPVGPEQRLEVVAQPGRRAVRERIRRAVGFGCGRGSGRPQNSAIPGCTATSTRRGSLAASASLSAPRSSSAVRTTWEDTP